MYGDIVNLDLWWEEVVKGYVGIYCLYCVNVFYNRI